MNRFAQSVIIEFGTPRNKNILETRIINVFDDPKVPRFLAEYMNDLMTNFKELIVQELLVSDPLPGTDVSDQVHCYNHMFVKQTLQYINTHVLVTEELNDIFTVSDDVAMSRMSNLSAKDTLAQWNMNSGRNIQIRDDPGAVYKPTWGTNSTNVSLKNYKDDPSDYKGESKNNCNNNRNNNCNNYINEHFTQNKPNQNYRSNDNHGIVFSDQSNLNTSNHVVQYENSSYKALLNGRNDDHTSKVFGVSTNVTDERLLQRNIFKKANGVENGIDHRETRIYARNLDTDITEGLRGAEYGFRQYGHDTSSLIQKTNHINNTRNKYSPNCAPKGNMHLYEGDARYH